uniref:Uncharacterized protein n=1 Tax=Anguilla anguilla TaxID=7936 RepID=A0A0E9WLP1_ANGAN
MSPMDNQAKTWKVNLNIKQALCHPHHLSMHSHKHKCISHVHLPQGKQLYISLPLS